MVSLSTARKIFNIANATISVGLLYVFLRVSKDLEDVIISIVMVGIEYALVAAFAYMLFQHLGAKK